jgi:hypothetical protein
MLTTVTRLILTQNPQLSWASEIPFYATVYLSKAILLALYFQIFPTFMGRRRRALWATVFYCALAYIVTLCMQLFSCMPLERHWYVTHKNVSLRGIY